MTEQLLLFDLEDTYNFDKADGEGKECSACNKYKPVFYDMKHSNNAAKIRLWMKLKDIDNLFQILVSRGYKNVEIIIK